MDPFVVEAVLRFLYSFSLYQYPPRIVGKSVLVFYVLVHTAADFFGLMDLEGSCVARFTAKARHEWNTDAFADAVEMVYQNAPDRAHKLRDAIVNLVVDHAQDISKEGDDSRLRSVISSAPELRREVSAKLANDRQIQGAHEEGLHGQYCTKCARGFAVDSGMRDLISCPYCQEEV